MRISGRLASVDDRPAIWALYQEALKPHIDVIWGWDQVWQIADFNKAFSTFTTYVIESDEKFGGYIQLQMREQEVYLSMLVLMPGMRLAGIGTAALSALHRYSQQMGLPLRFRVFRVNHAAKRFYERSGWYVASEDNAFFTMAHGSNAPLQEALSTSLPRDRNEAALPFLDILNAACS